MHDYSSRNRASLPFVVLVSSNDMYSPTEINIFSNRMCHGKYPTDNCKYICTKHPEFLRNTQKFTISSLTRNTMMRLYYRLSKYTSQESYLFRVLMNCIHYIINRDRNSAVFSKDLCIFYKINAEVRLVRLDLELIDYINHLGLYRCLSGSSFDPIVQ